MDPNQMPQAPFSPQPQPMPQPMPQPAPQPVSQPTPQPAPMPPADPTLTPVPPAEAQSAPAQPVINQAPQGILDNQAPASAPAKKKGLNKKIFIPILAIACIALVFGAGFLIYSLLSNTGHKGEKAMLSESIFVPKDSDQEKFALFSKDGKQLTEFDIENHSTMVADHAMVRNTDGKYGIINKDGKMTVDWQTGSIDFYGGLYRIASEKSSKDLLITGKGKELTVIGEDDTIKSSYYIPIVVVFHENGQAEVFTAYGDKIDDFEAKEEDCETDYSSVYIAVTCKGYIGIYNIYDLKKTTSIEDSDKKYDNFYANQLGDIFAFREESENYRENSNTAVYINGKFHDLGKLCRYIYVTSPDASIDNPYGGYASCYTEDGEYLIGKDGKVTDVDISTHEIFDADHYIHYDRDEDKAEIYVDGAKVKTMDCDGGVDQAYKTYTVSNDNKVTIYDLDGNQILSREGKYSRFGGIDDYGNTIFSRMNDDYETETILLNKDGKELSKKARSVYAIQDGYYYTQDKDDNTTLLDKNGKTIFENKTCGSVSHNKYTNRFVCNPSYDEDDGKVIVFDNSGKEIFSATGNYQSDGNNVYHIVIHHDDEDHYYTTDGKEFYTVK